jgi:D-serine deaminase-like pyridoxal phosphate-dependent protein
MTAAWYKLDNVGEVASPALLIYYERMVENLRRMLAIVGGDGSRLRPHIKTHKVPEIISLHLEQGITKFKCATIAEAEMLALAGARDVLLAYQPVGPNIHRLARLIQRFPQTRFSTIVDNERSIREISATISGAGLELDIFLDLDCGMHRTGVPADDSALELYRLITKSPALRAAGLQAYDGHIVDKDPEVRARNCEAALAPVLNLAAQLKSENLTVPRIVAGGTPTFPFHARRGPEVDCSPGTCVLWDFSYETKCPDLGFLFAALVLTRVVSKPAPNRLCLDLGHKAIASENPHPRVHLLDLPDAKFMMHSEEHLVIETEQANRFEIGDALYGVPWHVCPTVALHSEVIVVNGTTAGSHWPVTARARRLSI